MTQSFERLLEWICLFCGLILLVVWSLAGTIALRNIALSIGCITSFVWFCSLRPKISSPALFTILCLFAVPGWVGLLLIFSPTDIAAQLYDLRGTWLRVVLGIIMGGGLGLMIARSSHYIYGVWLVWIGLAFATFIWFLINASNANTWLISDFRGMFKYKHSVVYFVMWPCFFAYSVLHGYFLNINGIQSKNYSLSIGLVAILLVLICWLDFLAAHALNGILIAGMGGIALLTICFVKLLRLQSRRSLASYLLAIISIAVLISSATLFWQYDKKYEHKLVNLVSDIKVSAQIDKNTMWRRDPNNPEPYTPTDESGRAINGSTYERTAWFVKGVKLLLENPWGAGFSHMAFRYYMLLEKPNLNLHKTHSGWLDFALGIGLPGLLLTWFAMGSVIYASIKILTGSIERRKFLALTIVWILLAIWLLWFPSELSEREFIEHLFFMISLFAGMLVPSSERSVTQNFQK